MKAPRAFVWLPILLGVFAVLAVSGGAYWYSHQTWQTHGVTNEPQATIDQTVQTSTSANPKITGSAKNTDAVYVGVYGNGEKQWGSGNRTVSVVNGRWSAEVSIPCDKPGATCYYLQPGTYTVSVWAGALGGGPVLATSTLIIQKSLASVPGMSKYTDTDFGFSFWYPIGWGVEQHTPIKAPDSYYPGGTVVKSYNLMDKDAFKVAVNEVYAPESVTVVNSNGETYTLYFDTASHTWMRCISQNGVTTGSCANTSNIAPADVSHNTMGGLHNIGTFGSANIIPLSAHNFLIIEHDPETVDEVGKTVAATDPSVATPVSAAEQTKVIQAEKDAYVSSASNNALTATPTSGKTPLVVTFSIQQSAGGQFINFGDGTNPCTLMTPGFTQDEGGCDAPAYPQTFTHTYTSPGTYKVTASRHLPSTTLGTVTIVVQ